ncbi:MAG TPA: methyltransferase [Vicinamibacterales bacterium]|nr:methyltransferase [Vicinamibacterales bacterium]
MHQFFRPLIIPAALAVAVTVAALAQTPPQRTPEQYVALLEGADRVARMQVPRVVEVLNLARGMKVADLGSGSGLFTRPIAQAVAPGGLAYAIDIDQGLLDIVDARAREAGITNQRTILAVPDDPKLPEPVDVVLICDTLHHIAGQGEYLKTLAKYLKPGGRVAVIDFSDTWPEGHEAMRYTEAQLDAWMTAAGLSRVSDYDFLENSFFVIYRR